ncbi:hypothetical protein HHX47_DHR1000167 [Lentinula edodes]|nr:hypothetical protein HHX47_DHR1000167 [Lentinula edodes]
MPTVWFMVDDTDPRLKYSGSWTAVNNTGSFTNQPGSDFDEEGRTGSVYNNTLHYTTGNVTISFRFNGSSYLGVYGTQDGILSNGQLPFISCTLDGVPTWYFVDPYPTGLANSNMLACRADSSIGGSSPGEHELLINVTNYPNSDWYFDYITYESLNNPAFNGEVLQAGNAELIDASNYSMITFDAGWTDTRNDTTATNIPGSKAILQFNDTTTLDPSGEQGTAQTGGDLANGLANLKLQQRLAVLQGEIAHRDRQLAEGSVQQERAFTVHMDSGLRQIGEEEGGREFSRM